MLLILETACGPINIKLVDSPLMERWFQFHYNRQPNLKTKIGRRACGGERQAIPLTKINSVYSELKTAIAELKTLPIIHQLSVPIPGIPDTFRFDQHWCNDIHNSCFVRIAQHLFSLRSTAPNEKALADIENALADITSIGGRINDLIHSIEGACFLTTNRKFVAASCEHRYFSTTSIQRTEWFGFTEDEILHHSTLDTPLYDVCFKNEILGKSYLQGFLDEEDPSFKSVGPFNGTWNNLDIKLDSNRTLIYHSNQFRQWLSEKQIDPNSIQLEMPVGTLDDESRVRLVDNQFQISGTEVTFKFSKVH